MQILRESLVMNQGSARIQRLHVHVNLPWNLLTKKSFSLTRLPLKWEQ